MKPTDFPEANTTLARDQPQYQPLPVHIVDERERRMISCWSLTWRERIRLLLTGQLWISLMTFGSAPQPILPQAERPFASTLRSWWLARISFTVSTAHMRREFWPHHGPQAWSWWQWIAFSVVRLNPGSHFAIGGRLWVYTRRGALRFDVFVDRRDFEPGLP